MEYIMKNIFKGFRFDKREKKYTAYDSFNEEKGTYPIGDNWKNFILNHSIVDIKADEYGEYLTLILDNGVELIAQSNDGCGGCSNGWFTYTYKNVLTLGLKGNVITGIEVNCDYDYNCEYGTFSLHIYTIDNRLDIDFEGGDNGYYGIGINLIIEIPVSTMKKMCKETA